MIRRLPEVLALVFILVAVLLAIHQRLFSDDTWFSLPQIWHHETLIAVFLFGAVCLIIGKYLGRSKR